MTSFQLKKVLKCARASVSTAMIGVGSLSTVAHAQSRTSTANPMSSILFRSVNAVVAAARVTDKRARQHRPVPLFGAVATFAVAACAWLLVGMTSPTFAQSGATVGTAKNGANVAARAKGMFDVTLTPQPTDGNLAGVLDRMSADKQYHGDLDGVGNGQMLAARTPVKDSAAYVAVERVKGTLQGRSGSFVLLHRGVIDRGAQSLTVTVVPDSGTDQLLGLAGTMSITITDGKHFYDFEYTLPAR